jgi:hypothetical protein
MGPCMGPCGTLYGTLCACAGMKEMLELEYRVGVLELENMELEHSRMLHDLIVRQKDMKLRKLRLRVRDSPGEGGVG